MRRAVRSLGGLLALLAAAGVWAQQAAPTYYSLAREGKTLGYIRVDPSVRETRDGREVDVTATSLSVDVSALGQRILISSTSSTVLDAADGALVSYRWESTRGELKRSLSADVVDGKATLVRNPGTGEPTTTTIEMSPNTYIWGDNDIAGLSALVRNCRLGPDESREITVVGPDRDTKPTVSGLAGARRTILGVEREVRRITLDEAVVLCADPATDQLVLVEMADGTPVIELADASVVQAAEAGAGADVLASHFIKCEVPFTDFTKVTKMVAEIEFDTAVIGDGATSAESPMQRFEGTIEGGKIRGTVTIEWRPYAGENAAAFPLESDPPEDVGKFLAPSQYIESDDAGIVEMAKKLTEGATTTWEATQKLAGWVSANIAYTIADSPSAKLALKTRTGDCGPHATLTVAMLRAVGIPAKLVGGLTYAPQYGGSFGQHAWVEAHVGDQWVCLDPTTGEIDSLSAVHVKAFDGLGAVQPKKLHILEHEGGAVATGGRVVTRPLPYELSRDYVYAYREGEKVLGTETVRFEAGEGGQGYVATSRLDLDAGPARYQATRTIALTGDLIPTAWRSEATVGGKTTVVALSFAPGKVSARVEQPGQPPAERSAEIPPDALVVENNSMLAMGLALARMELPPGETTTFQFVQAEGLMTLALAFQAAAEPTEWLGAPCRSVDFPLAGAKLFVTDEGRFLGQQGPGDVRIELAEQ